MTVGCPACPSPLSVLTDRQTAQTLICFPGESGRNGGPGQPNQGARQGGQDSQNFGQKWRSSRQISISGKMGVLSAFHLLSWCLISYVFYNGGYPIGCLC